MIFKFKIQLTKETLDVILIDEFFNRGKNDGKEEKFNKLTEKSNDSVSLFYRISFRARQDKAEPLEYT